MRFLAAVEVLGGAPSPRLAIAEPVVDDIAVVSD
jgi:hypothetical protein